MTKSVERKARCGQEGHQRWMACSTSVYVSPQQSDPREDFQTSAESRLSVHLHAPICSHYVNGASSNALRDKQSRHTNKVYATAQCRCAC
jgi:hypothetical protein